MKISKYERCELSLEMTVRSFACEWEKSQEEMKEMLMSLAEDWIQDDNECEVKLPTRKYINVIGREAHEALVKNNKKMLELGLDPYYETIVYLKKWGGWLQDGE